MIKFFSPNIITREVLEFPYVFNHIFNGLVKKMVDDLEYKKKILKYHY